MSRRIIGAARRSAGSSGPNDPYWQNVVLLLQGSLLDQSPVAHTFTNHGVTLAPNGSTFGTPALQFSGSAWMESTGTGFDFGTGDFTVEAFIKPTSFGSYNAFLVNTVQDGIWTGNLGSALALHSYNNAPQVTGPLPAAGVDSHVAFVVASGQGLLFVDGSLIASASTSNFFPGGGQLFVGTDGSGGNFFAGLMNSIRATKGIARYTASFQKPTSLFPNQ